MCKTNSLLERRYFLDRDDLFSIYSTDDHISDIIGFHSNTNPYICLSEIADQFGEEKFLLGHYHGQLHLSVVSFSLQGMTGNLVYSYGRH